MDEEKNIEIIEKDFIKDQKKGQIFSFAVTIIVPLGILALIFIGINNISSKHSSDKQEILLTLASKEKELKNKETELENKEKVIRELKDDIDNIETKNLILATKLNESETKYKKLSTSFKVLQRNIAFLKRQLGFRSYVYYKGTTKNNEANEQAASRNP